MTKKILFDGWSLIQAPVSPAALHLLALLERLPATVPACLALPGAEPAWLEDFLAGIPHPPELIPHSREAGSTAWSRLAWEQQTLPGIARQRGIDALHMAGNAAPLIAGAPIVISPAEFPQGSPARSLAARLRQALGMGGAANARVVWPSDIPLDPSLSRHAIISMPPFTAGLVTSQRVSPELPTLNDEPAELPEDFVLYHGPSNEEAIHRLFAAWTWAAGPVGDEYPLVIAGFNPQSRILAIRLAESYHIRDSVRLLPDLPPASIGTLYQRCLAVFHPTRPAPWGDPLLHALACGKPIVSIESLESINRLGPAAYLAPAGDSRALGAALLSVLVEESLRELLTSQAVKRMLNWENAHANLERLWRGFLS